MNLDRSWSAEFRFVAKAAARGVGEEKDKGEVWEGVTNSVYVGGSIVNNQVL